MADAIVINKANTAPAGSIEKLKEAAARINPGAAVRMQSWGPQGPAWSAGAHGQTGQADASLFHYCLGQ